MFYSILPQSIITLIYSYDRTYHDIFYKCLYRIYIYGFNTRLNRNMYAPCMKQKQLVGYFKTTFSQM